MTGQDKQEREEGIQLWFSGSQEGGKVNGLLVHWRRHLFLSVGERFGVLPPADSAPETY